MYDQNDQSNQGSQPQDSNPYNSGQTDVGSNTGFSFNPPQPQGAPATTDDMALSDESSSASSAPISPTVPMASSDDLLDIKQNALQELNPLVKHLDQTPEEKFKTTMMMIQASDDQSLIKIAYEEAKKITDEKARAQALLDVVNEINYFTQQNNK
jgi:hypothetical protein